MLAKTLVQIKRGKTKMPRQTSKSGLAGKLGAKGKAAVKGHRTDGTSYGQMELPEGIEAGVAQLVDCKFDIVKEGKTNAGEYYFYAAGVVHQPKDAGGVPVEGLRTSIMEMVCDTPSYTRETVDDHLEWVLNEFRKLGVETEQLEVEDLETVAEQLKEEHPFFRFRTWKGQKQTTGQYAGKEPRVQHQWNGVCEYEGDGTEGEASDDTGEASPEETVEEPAVEESSGLAALAEAADGGDEEAAATIGEKAESAGIDPSEIATWTEVVELIEGAEVGAGGEAETPLPVNEDWQPAKEEIYFFKPKGARKRIEAEVTAVFVTKKVCNLRSLEDEKLYKGVSWEKLESE